MLFTTVIATIALAFSGGSVDAKHHSRKHKVKRQYWFSEKPMQYKDASNYCRSLRRDETGKKHDVWIASMDRQNLQEAVDYLEDYRLKHNFSNIYVGENVNKKDMKNPKIVYGTDGKARLSASSGKNEYHVLCQRHAPKKIHNRKQRSSRKNHTSSRKRTDRKHGPSHKSYKLKKHGERNYGF